jgi:hypothetical protein
MTESYHYDLSGEFIWITHILMGLFFVYVGYSILINKKLPPYISVSVIVLGVLGTLYHAHLYYSETLHENQKEKKM